MTDEDRRTVDAFRAQFESELTWLNTPGAPLGARPVTDALHSSLHEWSAGDFTWEVWDQSGSTARRLFSSLVGFTPSCIALVDSVADAASVVAETAHVTRIVVSSAEFVSCLQPFVMARRGLHVEMLPAEHGVCSTETYLEAITPGCLVVVSEVTSLTGNRLDLPAISARCREVSARFFVNLSQSLGALAYDPKGVDADYVACHAYKWLLAPRGCAFLAVRERLLDELMPIVNGWHSVTEEPGGLFGRRGAPGTTASRLDGSLAWLSWLGAPPALRLIMTVRSSVMERHVLNLAEQARNELQSSGFHPRPVENMSQIVCLTTKSPGECLARLRGAGIIAGTAAPDQVRIGIHGFNTEEHIAAFTSVLARDCRELVE